MRNALAGRCKNSVIQEIKIEQQEMYYVSL